MTDVYFTVKQANTVYCIYKCTNTNVFTVFKVKKPVN